MPTPPPTLQTGQNFSTDGSPLATPTQQPAPHPGLTLAHGHGHGPCSQQPTNRRPPGTQTLALTLAPGPGGEPPHLAAL